MTQTPVAKPLADVLRAWHKELGSVSAVAIYMPCVMLSRAGRTSKKLAAVWPEACAPMYERDRTSRDIEVEHESLVESNELGHARELAGWKNQEFGYYSRLSMPIAAFQSIDIYFLLTERPTSQDTQQYTGITLEWWTRIRQGLAVQHSPLSYKEVHCLAQAFAGKTSKETAVELGLSERNATAHIQNAMGKLGVTTKMAAVQKAIWLGHLA